jgi:cysteine desulfurase
LPNNISISFKNIEAESLLLLLDMNDICVSSGSACDSKSILTSSVLKAVKVPNDYIHGTIRITLSDDITFDELDYVYEKIIQGVGRLQSLKSQ